MGLEIKITDQCNLCCDYCYYRHGTSHPDMTFHEIKRTIDYFAESVIPRERESYDITFFGGEPLLKQDLIYQVVDHYLQDSESKIRFCFHVCTNGVLLDTEVLKALKQRSVGIYLSLDGAEAVHNTHRRFPDQSGSFSAISKNLKNIFESCKGVEQVITMKTADRVFESFLFLIENGFKSIMAIPDFSDNWTPEGLKTLNEQYGKILKYKEGNRNIYYSLLDDKLRLINSRQSYKQYSCNFG